MTLDLKDILSPQEYMCEHFLSTGESKEEREIEKKIVLKKSEDRKIGFMWKIERQFYF